MILNVSHIGFPCKPHTAYLHLEALRVTDHGIQQRLKRAGDDLDHIRHQGCFLEQIPFLNTFAFQLTDSLKENSSFSNVVKQIAC